ncbi:hypothetical protein FAUST_7280 [Fusarium austroamericanum]|uniref:Phosphatidylglycerol lysyltransferase C-terminal domain-containing protein n=1 Tax=Fusarium austroamericanum TaxID=282268 RepID=A0AAN6BYC6_FUSAU|nr:hypothetical protein FAUST_7280 [Fusarium austroamericanum]
MSSASSSVYQQSDLESLASRSSVCSSSTTTLDDTIFTRTYNAALNIPHIHCSGKPHGEHTTNSLHSRPITTTFDQAYDLFAQTSHMGILDPEYKVFTSQKGHGSLVYKIQARTVVVTGDPMCSEESRKPLLNELRHFRWAHGLVLAFVAVSESFAKYAQQQGWVTMGFGHEKVINPLTNKILRGQTGKRMLSQNKQLFDPKRGGVSMHLYIPSMDKPDFELQDRLQKLYDDWRYEKTLKQGAGSQTFVTVYDLFSYPESTIFLYTCDINGQIHGLAVLRRLNNRGYHQDPCIASQDAPRGITDLLIITALQLLKKAGINYLSLGFEPLHTVQETKSHSKLQSRLLEHGYNRTIKSVPVTGKSAFFNKFHPDESLSSNLFIYLLSKGIPIRGSIALMHFANINIRQLIAQPTLGNPHNEKQTSYS